MKMSEELLLMMKNFSSINSSLVLKKGNTQRSISSDKAILVEAELPDNIPVDFGIYDLNQFLGNITTMNNPELEFDAKSVTMNDDVLSLEYIACSPSLIVSPPDKELNMKNVDVSFEITKDVLNRILKLAAMNGLPNISIVGKNGKMMAMASDRKNDTSNTVKANLAEHSGEDFDVTFKVDNLKMIPDDYVVDVMVSGFAKFTSKTRKLKYFVALESK